MSQSFANRTVSLLTEAARIQVGASEESILPLVATPEQFQAAQTFNVHCLTGLIPCRCLYDLAPKAFQYLHKHPQAGIIMTNEDCPQP